MFNNRRILLGVTGGIASYKSAALARLLALAGAEVDVVLTRSAGEFIGRTTFQALTGRSVHSDLFGSAHALDHIRLAQRAELIVVAPATADFLARVVQGRADDLLAACILAAQSPVMLVPAMNDHMWEKPATQRNIRQLREDGFLVLEPDVGPLASGEGDGPGRMPEPETIFAHGARALSRNGPLARAHVVVTAGATREPLDPVRFLSNRSTGKMGMAIAFEAWCRGARVSLITGAVSAAPPPGVDARAVGTTEEMRDAVRAILPTADVLIMAAAPADFRPRTVAAQKLKKEHGPDAVELRPTPDILLSTMAARRPGCVVVGFALETSNALEEGRRKLDAKKLDLVVINDATEAGAGFEVDTNRVTFARRDGSVTELPLLTKAEVSERILDQVEELMDVGTR